MLAPSASISTPSLKAADIPGFRKRLLVASAVSALAVLCFIGTMLWAQNELSPPESVVAAQSLMLVHDGTLYYNLNQYPYTVCAYMPIFYLLEAAGILTGLPAFTAGRLISLLALAAIVVLCGKVAKLYTDDPLAAWSARLFAGSSALLLHWGTVGQVDMLACCFALLAFYFYGRNEIRQDQTLLAAGCAAALAVFTKQTSVAVAAAIMILLFLRDKKRAVQFALTWGTSVGVIVLALDWMLDGKFLANTVFANLNPMAPYKLWAQLSYFGSVSGCLLIITLAGARRMPKDVMIYLALASGVFLATASKIGSDTNYQIETAVVLSISAAISLHRMDFFRLSAERSRSWITLLILPAAVHLVVSYRVTFFATLARVQVERMHREEITALRPYVEQNGGLVWGGSYNSMVRLRQRLDVEPLILGLLVSAGAVDPEPLRRDLEQGRFTTVILDRDAAAPVQEADPEVGSMPALLLEQVRRRYRLAAHVSGDGFDAGFVYKPAPQEK